MAKKKVLVSDFLERIAVEAFEQFHDEITELAHGKHGFYALYDGGDLYYVGLAIDLRRRVKQHLKDRHAGKWDRFSLYLVHDADHIKELETLLLRIFDPRGNKHTGRLRQATNLQPIFKRAMKARQRKLLDEILPGQKRRKAVKRTKQGRTSRKRRPRPAIPLAGTSVCRKRIYCSCNGKEYQARVYASGRIKLNGKWYDTPHEAGLAITKKTRLDGWRFWRFRQDGELVPLAQVRTKD